MDHASQVTVTVGIPTIEPRGQLLSRALASVAEQTRPADAVVAELDIHRTGPAATRNRILDQVTTTYVAWLDDDDEFLPHHLDVLMQTAMDFDADLVYPCYARYDRFDPFRVDGTPTCGHPFDDRYRDYVLTTNNFIPITTLVRTELLRQVGGFPLPWADDWPHPSNEDWGCWKRLLNAGAKFVHAPSETWRWNRHGIDRRSARMIGT